MPHRGILNKRSVHPQGARNCSLKKVLQSAQQYFTHNNATRVRPEALAERYEGGINSANYLLKDCNPQQYQRNDRQ